MAQARRKAKRVKSGGGLAGVAILLAGMVIGSLATILWHGAQTSDDGVGAGIRRMVEDAFQSSSAVGAKNTGAPETNTDNAKPSTDFTFFTVLPEIEVPAPTAEQVAPPKPTDPPADSQPESDSKPKTETDTATAAAATDSDSAYMLQAGSYRRRPDADRLKATLALHGMVSEIQKVSIQGRGDFFRVRLGPYPTYKAMEKADEQLIRAGIKALRLKMFKPG